MTAAVKGRSPPALFRVPQSGIPEFEARVGCCDGAEPVAVGGLG